MIYIFCAPYIISFEVTHCIYDANNDIDGVSVGCQSNGIMNRNIRKI